jgi:hypothetical protein
MPARVRTRVGISAEAATASRMTRSADDRGRSGAGCHTGITPLYGLLGPANLVWLGGCQWWVVVSRPDVINGPRCSYLHYGEYHVKNGERAQDPRCAGAGVPSQLFAAAKRQNLVHCAILLRHGGKRQAVERDT